MNTVAWYNAVKDIQPHVVQILTPSGSGTGFLLSHSKKNGLSAIATAAHVIEHAKYWEEPIRIHHPDSEKSVIFHESERTFDLLGDDTAAIIIKDDKIEFPPEPLPLLEEQKQLKVGNDIGWIGFPAMAISTLCFFGGRISAWMENESAYLVDGVAINGVSGGPAFYIRAEDGAIVIMGVVSAYRPNRATGEVLPGLSIVRGVSQFHEMVSSFRSSDKTKKTEKSPKLIPLSEESMEVLSPNREK